MKTNNYLKINGKLVQIPASNLLTQMVKLRDISDEEIRSLLVNNNVTDNNKCFGRRN